MPTDVMLITALFVFPFVLFAAVLAWAERQTRGLRRDDYVVVPQAVRDPVPMKRAA